MSVSYPSQSEYGYHGMRICSPVCLLVCSNFMHQRHQHQNLFSLFTPNVIHSYMEAAHALYAQKFPDAREPELIQAILPEMPHVTCHEVAGLLSANPDDAPEAGIGDVEGLHIASLPSLLTARANVKQPSSAVIVTMAGHSTAFLFHQEVGRVYHFDPLVARLRDVTPGTARGTGELLEYASCAGRGTEYDGLLLLDA